MTRTEIDHQLLYEGSIVGMKSYFELKQNARAIAEASIDETSDGTGLQGEHDCYSVIMSNRDDSRQSLFLFKITQIMTIEERQVLLNGLAKEYSDADGWLGYCSVNESTQHAHANEWYRGSGLRD